MRTRRLVRGFGWAGRDQRLIRQARIAAVRARFCATGRPVPGVNATIKWLLSHKEA